MTPFSKGFPTMALKNLMSVSPPSSSIVIVRSVSCYRWALLALDSVTLSGVNAGFSAVDQPGCLLDGFWMLLSRDFK